jgi:hypothetical protein
MKLRGTANPIDRKELVTVEQIALSRMSDAEAVRECSLSGRITGSDDTNR